MEGGGNPALFETTAMPITYESHFFIYWSTWPRALLSTQLLPSSTWVTGNPRAPSNIQISHSLDILTSRGPHSMQPPAHPLAWWHWSSSLTAWTSESGLRHPSQLSSSSFVQPPKDFQNIEASTPLFLIQQALPSLSVQFTFTVCHYNGLDTYGTNHWWL